MGQELAETDVGDRGRAARVRPLNTGQINKTDHNDVRLAAVAALRAHELPDALSG